MSRYQEADAFVYISVYSGDWITVDANKMFLYIYFIHMCVSDEWIYMSYPITLY